MNDEKRMKNVARLLKMTNDPYGSGAIDLLKEVARLLLSTGAGYVPERGDGGPPGRFDENNRKAFVEVISDEKARLAFLHAVYYQLDAKEALAKFTEQTTETI